MSNKLKCPLCGEDMKYKKVKNKIMLTIKEHMQDFAEQMQPFGNLDLERALQILEDLQNIDRDKFDNYFLKYQNTTLLSVILYRILDEEAEDLGMKIKDLDPCYEVLNYILQVARNEIFEKTDFDIQNCKYSIEVYENYLDSSFDHSEEAVTDLEKAIKESDKSIEELKENIFVNYLLNEIQQ